MILLSLMTPNDTVFFSFFFYKKEGFFVLNRSKCKKKSDIYHLPFGIRGILSLKTKRFQWNWKGKKKVAQNQSR